MRSMKHFSGFLQKTCYNTPKNSLGVFFVGKYFTERERYQLEAMLQDGIPKTQIAQRLGKSYQTIFNEIKRGLVTLLNTELKEYTAYKADVAQRISDENQTAKGRNYKIGNDFDLVYFIEDKILNEKWSPAAVIGYIRANNLSFSSSICYKTLYNYIHSNLFLNLSEKDLLHYRKHKKEFVRVAKNNAVCTTIEERPEDVKERAAFGHWEMDTVVSGRGGTGCLLVLSERKTRFEIIRKLNNKTQAEVKRALDELELSLPQGAFPEHFKTITCDNGTEFLDADAVRYSRPGQKRTELYYCHPFASWERGTNENINKMIRRWIPKGSDISKWTDADIRYIEHWVNSFPRKIFGYRSAYDMLREEAADFFP